MTLFLYMLGFMGATCQKL